MKNTTKTKVAQLRVSNHNKAKALLTGAAVLQLAAATSIGAATTSIVGGTGGLDPWATQGTVSADLPTPTGSIANVNLVNTTTVNGNVGNWSVSSKGSSSVALGFANLASWAATTNITSTSVQFHVDPVGLVGSLVQVPVFMNWSATIALPSVAFEANTQYDVTFDLDVAAGLLSNAASVSERVSFIVIDGNGDPVDGFTSGDFIDLVGLFGADPSGIYTKSFTTGDTAPVGDIRLQFLARKGISAEALGLSNEYIEISGLTMDATPVPEPSGALLLGAGALLLILKRRV